MTLESKKSSVERSLNFYKNRLDITVEKLHSELERIKLGIRSGSSIYGDLEKDLTDEQEEAYDKDMITTLTMEIDFYRSKIAHFQSKLDENIQPNTVVVQQPSTTETKNVIKIPFSVVKNALFAIPHTKKYPKRSTRTPKRYDD